MRESDERKGASISFVAAFLDITVGGTGRDADLLRRSRRQRAVIGAFAGVTELLRTERSLQHMAGLDAANLKGICPWPAPLRAEPFLGLPSTDIGSMRRPTLGRSCIGRYIKTLPTSS